MLEGWECWLGIRKRKKKLKYDTNKGKPLYSPIIPSERVLGDQVITLWQHNNSVPTSSLTYYPFEAWIEGRLEGVFKGGLRFKPRIPMLWTWAWSLFLRACETGRRRELVLNTSTASLNKKLYSKMWYISPVPDDSEQNGVRRTRRRCQATPSMRLWTGSLTILKVVLST